MKCNLETGHLLKLQKQKKKKNEETVQTWTLALFGKCSAESRAQSGEEPRKHANVANVSSEFRKIKI